ncbi:MAG: hypothetical protein J0I99_00635 [Devosia sp.]|uniref:hypothetical protein n=1 Tax=Devosia sp. TaxID=1871048 RepID=UPI001ACD6B5A|nr:hypothetical protein [Devosia sp.]MBN9314223.1 hypothetical protein [Devosia sp.]
MPVAFSERRVERGVHIIEERYKSGLVEIAYYESSQRRVCLCIVERQPSTRKWHLFGRTGNRPMTSGRIKADILRAALAYACEQRALLTPATHGTPETVHG